MGKVIILPETTKYPITLMGKRAGVCWGADTSDDEKNYRRGLDCLESGHGRVLEYVNVELVLDGYSARVIREWYTHVGGSPSRLQASTRYINYTNNFEYVTPPSILCNSEAFAVYNNLMHSISKSAENLMRMGISREDAAMTLPLAMATRVVDKRNVRSHIDMSRNRMCARAYWEFRQLIADIHSELKAYSPEWATIVKSQMMPKCEYLGYCPEKYSCGRKQQLGKGECK
jgi:thymidylate synthase (FAD)